MGFHGKVRVSVGVEGGRRKEKKKKKTKKKIKNRFGERERGGCAGERRGRTDVVQTFLEFESPVFEFVHVCCEEKTVKEITLIDVMMMGMIFENYFDGGDGVCVKWIVGWGMGLVFRALFLCLMTYDKNHDAINNK